MESLFNDAWMLALGAIFLLVAQGYAAAWAWRSSQPFYSSTFVLLVALWICAALLVINSDPTLITIESRDTLAFTAPALACMLGNYWLKGWLCAHSRDRFMNLMLIGGMVACAALIAIIPFLPENQKTITAFGYAPTLGIVTMSAACMRAAMLGDRMAGLLGLSALLGLRPAWTLIQQMTQPSTMSPFDMVLAPLLAVVACAMVISILLLRQRHRSSTRRSMRAHEDIDTVTKLPIGVAFIRALEHDVRLKRLRRNGGICLCVVLQNQDKILQVQGTQALNDVYVHLAGRIERELDTIDLVGRYYENCFVASVGAVRSTSQILAFAKRFHARMNRSVTRLDGYEHAFDIQPDVLIGIVSLTSRNVNIDKLLFDVQAAADHGRYSQFGVGIMGWPYGHPIVLEEYPGGRHNRSKLSSVQD